MLDAPEGKSKNDEVPKGKDGIDGKEKIGSPEIYQKFNFGDGAINFDKEAIDLQVFVTTLPITPEGLILRQPQGILNEGEVALLIANLTVFVERAVDSKAVNVNAETRKNIIDRELQALREANIPETVIQYISGRLKS